MAKSIFRYLRGELNGFYLTRIHETMNVMSSDLRTFFGKFQKQQFDNGKIEDEVAYGLGKFAGVMLPRLAMEEVRSSLKMTESYTNALGEERSERGLFLPEDERFDFSHSETTEDINTFATTESKSSLVGDEAPVGYIATEELNILDENGNVKQEYILDTPPEEGTYTDFYGNEFLFLSEDIKVYTNLSTQLYIPLVKAMQKVRYNGMSISTLCDIIKLICPSGLVKIDKIELSNLGNFVYIYYNYDENAEVNLKTQRLYVLKYIVDNRFPQIELIENN